MINTIKVTSFNSFQLICTGKFDEEWLSELNKIWLLICCLRICFIIGMIATVSTHVLKQIDKEQVLKPFPKPRENTVDLGSLIRSALSHDTICHHVV